MDQLFSKIKQQLAQSSTATASQQLLQTQRANQLKINELLEQSANALQCGPDCQKAKISDQLKQKYVDAKTAMQTAPITLEQTEKNYYVYTQGEPYYDRLQETELTQKATSVAQALETNFNEELVTANTMNAYLNTALLNSANTQELLDEYIEKNKSIQSTLQNQRGDILTNDRKTYYETEANDRLALWYRFLWYIYYICVVTIVLALFLSPGGFSMPAKIGFIGVFAGYPYYVGFIRGWVYDTYMWIYSQIPKNVYNTL
jgi:hypothetical protein